MGIDATLAYHLAATARTFDLRGSLCTLGVQTIRADHARIDRVLTAGGITGPHEMSFYARLGFDRVESLDVSDFEGCTQIFDLNTPGIPRHLYEQFDCVYNGGTLEHVFDTRTALRNVFELLTVGGVVIHAGPANGWLEHGFYQFSPTLLVDYYLANRFEILEACIVQAIDDPPGAAVVYPFLPGAFDERLTRLSGRSLFYMTFRKQPASTWEAIPQQRYYTEIYGAPAERTSAARLRYSPPFRLQDGVRQDDAPHLHPLSAPRHAEGFEWHIHVPENVGLSDGVDRTSSRLILFEDGVAIGPPHAPHAEIRTLGAGRYSHWEEWLRFSPTRNDDARDHVYAYALATHQW